MARKGLIISWQAKIDNVRKAKAAGKKPKHAIRHRANPPPPPLRVPKESLWPRHADCSEPSALDNGLGTSDVAATWFPQTASG